jgi:uncharacterized protein YndB with AHSA1/START domain
VVADSDPAVVVRRTIPAPRAKVFEAWTSPAILRRWFRGSADAECTLCELDVRVGGSYRLGMNVPSRKASFLVVGEYLEVVPPSRLVYTWNWQEPDQHVQNSLVTVEFYERGESTEVVVTHRRLPSEADRQDHGRGWSECLANLERELTEKA